MYKHIKPIFILILFIGVIFSQGFTLNSFSLEKTASDSTEGINELKSNGISEIKLQGDSTVWLGTGQGLSMMRDLVSILAIDSLSLSDGTKKYLDDGISAIGVFGDNLIIAAATSDGVTPIGSGLYFTENSLEPSIIWVYHDQPQEDTEEDSLEVSFGGRYFTMLPVTTAHANVSYDAAISNDYIWITSWAGGLRRVEIDSASIPNQPWTNVPLPNDNDEFLMTCDEASYVNENGKDVLKDYYLNPNDPSNGGNHNHKAFSVLAYGDTVWVGTANGINRGLLGQNGCIDWEHFSFPQDGISGNFVVGLARQVLNSENIIWAVTMNAEAQGEERGLSYTTNDGITWKTTLFGERVYNIVAQNSLVFAASENGLWKAVIDNPNDEPVWALFQPAKQVSPIEDSLLFDVKEILTNEVISVAFDDREDDQSVLWLGTWDGLARSSDLHGSNWTIFQAEYDPTEVYAYPNPYSPYSHNVLDGDGYVRFHTSEVVSYTIKMSIYNFALGIVFIKKYDRRSGTESLKWDGKDQNGKLVDNGVYFINLKFAEKQNRSPEDHWLKLIVVK